MERRPSLPRGLVGRSVLAVGVFAVAAVPGWTLGDLAERWTAWGLLDWLVTWAWTAAAVGVLGPWASYRRRDAWLGLIPVFGWYLISVISWRVALLPYRDWEPRADELWQARWLTGDLIGYWRTDRPATGRQNRSGKGRSGNDRTHPDRARADRPGRDRTATGRRGRPVSRLPN